MRAWVHSRARRASVCVCVWVEFCSWVLCFAMGYMLQFGEMEYKRVHSIIIIVVVVFVIIIVGEWGGELREAGWKHE